MTAAGSDAKYFQTTKKGEIHELKSDLNSFNKDKIKEAVKKVIAAMTVGKDVGTLFTDVVKNMQTDNIELKKLIYLYIINYARSHPDKAILIVSTFQKDAEDKSPLVRALAIRTMGCIRVDRITEYLCEPLAKALKDKDPYVRKTAAVCVAKLYDLNKELVEEQGFLETLRNMISDPNPMVVANAVAALAEISEASGKDVFQINSSMLQKLLAALNECTEWGQVFILDCLAKYQPSPKDAEDIVERVSPRLKHVNSAVAMSAVKVIIKYLDIIQNEKLAAVLMGEKLPPPLITLLSEGKPEIQYVALRNINLIVQKRPDILAHGVKHFFCKYNDPIYVKMEKLEIMIKLASIKNIEKVLMEFKEYASEVDVEFVRKAVLAIGRCAIKLDKAAEKCIKVLLELIETKVNYVVQEAVIVIKDIFRKYPNRYENIIAKLCENLESLDEPEAKASMIWIIGEYADRIDNSPALLESFVETFNDENPQVQLQLLTGVVKLFLKRPDDGKAMVGKVLNLATNNTDNPDLRDRGYVYWRLLSTDPEAAQQVVLTSKPPISDDTFQLDPSVLDVLISNISTLSSIYHKPPEFFVKDGKTISLKPSKGEKKVNDEREEGEESGEEEEGEGGEIQSDITDLDEKEAKGPEKKAPDPGKPAQQATDFLDLLNLTGSGAGASVQAPLSNPGTSASTQPSGSTSSFAQAAARVVLAAQAGKGLQLSASYTRRQGVPYMDILFENQTQQTLSQFAIKFNSNYLGLAPGAPLKPGNVAAGGQARFSLPLAVDEKAATQSVGPVQMAIKTELGVFVFADRVPPYVLFQENGALPKDQFLKLWASIPDVTNEVQAEVQNRTASDVEAVKNRMATANVFFVASPKVKKRGDIVYCSLMFRNVHMLVEVTLNGPQCNICIKSENPSVASLVMPALCELMTL